MADLTNRDRAEFARTALSAMADEVGGKDNDVEIQLGDLMANLMHLCDVEAINFQACVRRGLDHYVAELKGED